jgi:predicted kinase
MTHQPVAHLLHGFLDSGKTTYAKQLEQKHGAMRFTHDEWMSALYGDDPPEAQFQDYAIRVSRLMEITWTRLLDLGLDIVLDCGFWSRSERERVAYLIRQHGGIPTLYHLRCPETVAWKRIEERNGSLGGSLYISRNTFDVLKARFEPLGQDEPCVQVETG